MANYEVLARPIDVTEVPNIRANRSIKPEHVTIRTELDEAIATLLDKVAQLRNEINQSEQSDTQNWNNAVDGLETRLNNLIDGVANSYAVAAAVDTLAEATINLPGLDVTATDWHSWVLVKGVSQESGVYRFQNNQLVRVPKFANASSLTAGTSFFDNAGNVLYRVSEDAAPGGEVPVQSVEIIPYDRQEKLTGTGFLKIVANQLNAGLNSQFFTVADGELTLSTEFAQWCEDTIAQNASTANTLGELTTQLAGISSQLAQTNASVANLIQAVGSATSQIESLQQHDQETDTRIDGVETQLGTLRPRVETLEQEYANQEQAIAAEKSRVDSLTQAVGDQASQLLTQQRQVSDQGQRLNSLDASVTDARSTIAAHTNQLGQLTTNLNSKVDSSQLDDLQETKLASLVKSFTLTNGTVEQRIDTDDGVEYYFTEFRRSTGWGHNRFRSFDLSDVLSPYTKQGYSFTFQRVGVDEFRVLFQSRTAPFPNDKVDISLIRIPGPAQGGIELNPTNPDLAVFKQNFFNWTNWDGRYDPGTWDRVYRGIAMGQDGRGIVYFANGNSLSQNQIDAFYNAGDLGSVDVAAGLVFPPTIFSFSPSLLISEERTPYTVLIQNASPNQTLTLTYFYNNVQGHVETIQTDSNGNYSSTSNSGSFFQGLGNYRVEITINGQTYSNNFTVQ